MNPYLSSASRVGLIIIAAILTAPRAVMAIDFFWNTTADGAFGDFNNWDGPSDDPEWPGPTDLAIFDVAAEYTVRFEQPRSTARVLLRRGLVTFDLDPGGEYLLLATAASAPCIVVGDENGDFARLAAGGGVLRGTDAEVGRAAGAYGDLAIEGAEAGLHLLGALRVGREGTGLLDLRAGAGALTDDVFLGFAGGAFGVASVHDPGSTWKTLGSMTVGTAGVGILTIEEGATVDCAEAVVGQALGAIGDVVVRGPGTRWTIDGSLDVGLFGFGTLLVEDGAVVSNGIFATIGAFTSGVPQGIPDEGAVGAIVRGPGSLWSVDGDLWVGLVATASLEIGDGGRVDVADDLILTAPANGSMTFILTPASASGGAAVDVGGAIVADRRLLVALGDGFTPSAGDVFPLVTAGSGAGAIDLALPALPHPTRWIIERSPSLLALRAEGEVFGDVTGDAIVGLLDLTELLNGWGPCPAPPADYCPTDLDGDGATMMSDLVLMLNAWGR